MSDSYPETLTNGGTATWRGTGRRKRVSICIAVSLSQFGKYPNTRSNQGLSMLKPVLQVGETISASGHPWVAKKLSGLTKKGTNGDGSPSSVPRLVSESILTTLYPCASRTTSIFRVFFWLDEHHMIFSPRPKDSIAWVTSAPLFIVLESSTHPRSTGRAWR